MEVLSIISHVLNLIRNVQTDGTQRARISDGAWTPSVSVSGYLSDDLYAADVSRWKVPWARGFHSFGEVTTSGAVSNHPVWPTVTGSALAVPQSVRLSVVSSSAQDSAAGTGIRKIHIHYLDGNLNPASEEVTMNGTTPVDTSASDIRFVQCVHAEELGSGKAAAGNITLSHSGTNYAVIATGKRRCESSFRRVPAGKRLMIKSMYAGSSSGSAAASSIVRFVMTWIEGHDFTESGITIPQSEVALQDVSQALTLDMPIGVPAGMVVWFEVKTDKAATVTAWFNWYLEDE